MKYRVDIRGPMIPNDYKFYYDYFGEDSTCPRDVQQVIDALIDGDEVEVDFDSGMIYNRTKGTQFKGQAFPEFMQKIIKAEGLVNYINSQQ